MLTTFEALRSDLFFDFDAGGSEGGEAEAAGPAVPPLSAGRTLRGIKRHLCAPTPLTRLIWWRVILDEAQVRVEI